jgi:hypothetical protein
MTAMGWERAGSEWAAVASIAAGNDGVNAMTDSIRTAVVLAIIGCAVSPAFGQRRGGARQTASQVPRYTPASPTVSPYVNLLNRNGGGAATNYYGLIRPLQRQSTINAAQSQAISSQEQQINTVKEQQESFEQPAIKPTGTAGWFQNLGTTSPYQVSSHYYGQWQTGKSQKRAGR